MFWEQVDKSMARLKRASSNCSRIEFSSSLELRFVFQLVFDENQVTKDYGCIAFWNIFQELLGTFHGVTICTSIGGVVESADNSFWRIQFYSAT